MVRTNEILTVVREMVRGSLRNDEFADDGDIFDAGATSMTVVDLQFRLEERLKLQAPTHRLMALPSIQGWTSIYSTAASEASSKFRLTPEEVARFRRDGYIGPFTLYTPDDAQRRYRSIRAELYNREFAVYDLKMDSIIANYDRHLDVDLLSEHVCRAEIVERVSSILGPDVICWRSEMFPKYPGNEGTDWHQADTFAHASGKPQIIWPDNERFGGALTVWTALTDATEENGCLRFMPGTHEEMFYDETKKMQFRPEQINALEKDGIRRGFYGYDYRSLQKDPNWKPDESQAKSIVMQAGQFVIFWSTLMHSSFPNTTTNQMRLGYASRYVPAHVRVYPDTDHVEEYGSQISLAKFGNVLVAGEDRLGVNKIITKNTRGFEFQRIGRTAAG